MRASFQLYFEVSPPVEKLCLYLLDVVRILFVPYLCNVKIELDVKWCAFGVGARYFAYWFRASVCMCNYLVRSRREMYR